MNSLEEELNQRKFFQVIEKKAKMMQNLRNIFNRIPNLTSQEVRTLHGIVRNLTRGKE